MGIAVYDKPNVQYVEKPVFPRPRGTESGRQYTMLLVFWCPWTTIQNGGYPTQTKRNTYRVFFCFGFSLKERTYIVYEYETVRCTGLNKTLF